MKVSLIIESGSTKADWIFYTKDGAIDQTDSVGLNPKIISPEKLEGIMEGIISNREELNIQKVYFYGSGVLRFEHIIEESFQKILPNTAIQVKSDLYAAAIASSYKDKVICILGTGSVIAGFKKDKLKETKLGHGYILGDLCSGSEMGKILVRDYVNNDLPSKLGDKINFSPSEILETLYKQETPNRFLASFFPLISKNKSSKYAQELIKNQIDLLDRKGIAQFKADYKNLTFVGGVAGQLKDELKAAFKKDFELEFVTKPIDRLLKFHLSENLF